MFVVEAREIQVQLFCKHHQRQLEPSVAEIQHSWHILDLWVSSNSAMLLVYDSSYNFEPVFLNTRQLLLDLRVDVARSDRFLSRCGNTLFLELVLHELSSGLSLLEDDSDHYE